VVVHNGICCERDTDYYNREFLGAIVLLKDKYRPYVDVARDKIRQLTLEATSDIDIIYKQLYYEGFDVHRNDFRMEITRNRDTTLKEFWGLFENRADFVERFIISTQEGEFSIEQLRRKLNDGANLELKRAASLSSGNLYMLITFAYLRKEFMLKFKVESAIDDDFFRFTRFVLCKGPAEFIDGEELFPPVFFLKPVDNTYAFLALSDEYTRSCCNSNHRFSIWLIKNHLNLAKYAPGILKEIMRVLAGENGENIVLMINDLLEHLRKLPGYSFGITNELFLKDDDIDYKVNNV
jgi:hypothetical protein